MNFHTTATTVGAKSYFISDEHVVVQDLVNLIGAGVKTLFMEFVQAAYERFLQGSAGSVKPARSSEGYMHLQASLFKTHSRSLTHAPGL